MPGIQMRKTDLKFGGHFAFLFCYMYNQTQIFESIAIPYSHHISTRNQKKILPEYLAENFFVALNKQ